MRRFYELGQLYQPQAVILQFCASDPADNLLNAVTSVEGGRFVFRPTESRVDTVKRYLSRSLLQESQIYSLLREAGHTLLRRAAPAGPAGAEVPPDEASYMALLEVFAADLHRRGTPLLLFAVERQLDRFPALRARVADLQRRGLLRYVEMMDWFPDGQVPESGEGHWAGPAHRVVGEHLAEIIERQPVSGSASDPTGATRAAARPPPR